MDLAEAQTYLQQNQLDAWLVYDYKNLNPVFTDILGAHHATRRTFYIIPAHGDPVLLVHSVDVGQFPGMSAVVYLDRLEMVSTLRTLLAGYDRVALEYSPMSELPNVSYVDAGTLELIRSLGPTPISSADLYQYACARWTPAELASHQRAAHKLGTILEDVYAHLPTVLGKATEYDIQQFILRAFTVNGLETPDGPVVAANAHGSDPHFAPTTENSVLVARGDWLLIDLWAKEPEGVFADATWVAFLGNQVPAEKQEVFDVVIEARDRAFQFLAEAFVRGEPVQGWQVDAVARDFIAGKGFGRYFTHRLGHSLGTDVHGRAVNLDGFETKDTRTVIEGIGLTIEPGIYLPEFGMRSEIDVYMGTSGPTITTPLQKEVVKIG